MRKLLGCIACLLASSCNIYNSDFDCPPGKGVGCASVGEVLDLIVEKEGEEDLFVHDKRTALLLKQQKKSKKIEKKSAQRTRTNPKLVLVQQDSGELILVEEANR